jgi:hypothetical protein
MIEYKFDPMKQTCILTLLCAFSILAFCQQQAKPLQRIYFQAAAGATTHSGFATELGVQAIFKSHWTATFSYNNIAIDPKGMPGDYKPGYTLFLIFPLPDEYPSASMSIISLTGGKSFEVGRNKWFTAEAGISFVNGEQFTFVRQPVVEDLFYVSSNYAVTKEKKSSIGGMLKADINWAFSRYFGLGLGTFANFNSVQSPVGYKLKLIIGWMDRQKYRAT